MTVRFENRKVPKIDEVATFGDLTFRSFTLGFENGMNGEVGTDVKSVKVLFYSTGKKDFVEIEFPSELQEKIEGLKRKQAVVLKGDVSAFGWYASLEQANGFVSAESGLKFMASDFSTTNTKPTNSSGQQIPPKKEEKTNQ
ncbi:hypothetical protein BCR24_06525 [Enterococcus ureilyticus]|uniref:DUF961 domain-containing protein n=1 Tax=Enterococcus ureilyticus TaxID=1131292 RepID=A0A1E5H9D3_9ENTE|nr:hypothetical protein [Enterococcus ureilyticus]MBM7688423.1 hypothetical protein [Enterococcus ureilyticus]OEG21524.1 hypothetical protein BCR24_06525 [Enterococcus ureilyticus]